MSEEELWELMSIICEGQDSEQRRKVEQYITDLQKEIEKLNNIINELENKLKYNIKHIDNLLKPKKGVKPYGREKECYENYKEIMLEVLEIIQELKEVNK